MSLLRIQEIEEVYVVDFTDGKILEEGQIAKIGQELMNAAVTAGQKKKKLLINFQHVQFMSSAMIGKLVLLNNKCKSDEIALKICNISSNVMEIFKITMLNKVFEIYENEDKAIKSFTKMGG